MVEPFSSYFDKKAKVRYNVNKVVGEPVVQVTTEKEQQAYNV